METVSYLATKTNEQNLNNNQSPHRHTNGSKFKFLRKLEKTKAIN